MKRYCSYFILLLILNQFLLGQNPVAFQIGSEEGIPNQTIYSIIQDKKGFIWLGTDAGLCKYDGIRYYEYKNSSQKSRSVTGLVESNEGIIYMYNFSGQIFYVENDSLQLLNSWDKGRISNICTDTENNLWVCYNEGVMKYSNKTKKWTIFCNTPILSEGNNTHSCFVDKQKDFWCIGPNGLIQISNSKVKNYPIVWRNKKVSGEYQLTFFSKQKFIFSTIDGEIYYLSSGKIVPFYSKNLNPLIAGKKITRVEEDENECIWIYTFSGVIVYDTKHDTSKLFYEDKSFSGGIKDIENTYWLSTLHEGVLKIPELPFKLWSVKEESSNTKITKIVAVNSTVFFATTNGKIGELNTKTNQINLISLNNELDVQCLVTSANKKSVLFGIQNSVFQLKQPKILKISDNLPPAKDLIEINNNYIIATSKGVFWHNPTNKIKDDTLTNLWCRSVLHDSISQKLYLATNEGVKIFMYQNNHWVYKDSILNAIQINSMCFSSGFEKIYALSFDGKIYEISKNRQVSLLITLNQNCAANQIKANDKNIFIASNKGLWIYNIYDKHLHVIDKLSGLASNDVYGLAIDEEFIWVASSNGIQQIPIDYQIKKTLPKLYLKAIYVNNKEIKQIKKLELNYSDKIKIKLDAIAFSSENKFQYAYRLNKNSNWIFLPAEINKIEIPALNSGLFELEIKLIDHLGRDSKNKITISGYVNPPFWQRLWFYILIGIICLIIAYAIFKQRIYIIKKKQAKELERIKLEHELKLSQETALRAQMNPHFIFNVLNSIKGYIYENDKKKAAAYLQRFSDLVRKILEQSSVSWVKLDEEIELLKLYIELEAMMLSEAFDYELQVDENLLSDSISIPSLMLQPFIENAFKHGLRHKAGNKRLQVIFFRKEDLLLVTITDNGIGRQASEKINSQTDKKHKSFSTNAIDRITTINKDQPGVVSIVYSDVKDEEQNSQGTTVTISIRYHE